MKDESALQLLSEMALTSRETTESHQPAFWWTFLSFAGDLNRVSRQINNDGLRQSFFLVRTLVRDPFQAKLDHELQNRVKNQLERTDQKRANSLEEVSLSAATSISMNVISEQEGRDVIDMEYLRRDVEDNLENVGSEGTVRVLLDISDAVRQVYDVFVDEYSQETVAFYSAIEESCELNWKEVHNTLTERLIEEDRQASTWKRSDIE